MESLLRVKNLDVYRGRIHVLKGLSLHVKDKEIVALIGANGAGKSTLLDALSGLLRVSSGEVFFSGMNVTNWPAHRLVSLGIVQVPEGRHIFSSLSVLDNLMLGAYHRYSTRKRTEIEADLQQVLELFPVLRDMLHLPAGSLSGGQQQMLAIARGLMARPRLLLLDEPSTGLAPALVKEIFRYILLLREKMGLTVLLVEQNAKAALKVADRGYVIETGRVVLEGKTEDLLQSREIERAYLGRDLDAELE